MRSDSSDDHYKTCLLAKKSIGEYFHTNRRSLQKSEMDPRSRIFHNTTRVLNMRHASFYPGPTHRPPFRPPRYDIPTAAISTERVYYNLSFNSFFFPSPQSDHSSHITPASSTPRFRSTFSLVDARFGRSSSKSRRFFFYIQFYISTTTNHFILLHSQVYSCLLHISNHR